MVLNGSSHAQWGSRLRAHYCVIGSGMGGAAVARTLAEAGEDVLLVEAGLDTPDNGTSPVSSEITGRPFDLPVTRCIELGGTSNAWHGICTPLEEIDFQPRPWIPNSGWPICLEDLIPYYRAASVWLLEMPDAPYDPEALQDRDSKRLGDIKFDPEVLENKLVLSRKPAFRWKDTLLKLIRAGKMRCLFGAVALDLQQSSDATRVEKLLVGTNSGTAYIEADIFVVCAGALETPRLLLNSKSRDENGLGNRHDLVGRYLLDHPTGQFSKLRFHSALCAPMYAGTAFRKGVRIMAGLKLTSDQQYRHRLPNHGFWMRPGLALERVDNELLRSFMAVRRKRDLSLAQVWAILSSKDIWYRILVVRCGLPAIYLYSDPCFYAEQLPNPESRVRLSEKQRDRWGFPVASVNWQLTEDDFRLFREYTSLVFSQGLRSDQYKLAREDAPEIWSRTLTSAAHHAGTARMADHPSRGVVDKNLRVFGVSNLYICDASVFPTNGSANPSLTIGALGIRLGERLLNARKGLEVKRKRSPIQVISEVAQS
jgi:choline dehydrogenase-like flavoprotein